MKPIDQPRIRPVDIVRSVFYTLMPLFCVASIWTFAWARALETKVARDERPRYDRTAAVDITSDQQDSPNPDTDTRPTVISIADQN